MLFLVSAMHEVKMTCVSETDAQLVMRVEGEPEDASRDLLACRPTSTGADSGAPWLNIATTM
jgi:hypothetical protein